MFSTLSTDKLKIPISLSKFNKYAVIAHVLSFLIIAILYLSLPATHKFSKTQTYRYQLPTVAQAQGTCNSDSQAGLVTGKCRVDTSFPPPKKAGSFNTIYGVLIFFAITAYAHIYYATDGFKTGNYSAALARGWNPYRWIEYGASASVMTVLIGTQLGIKDANHLASLVFINLALQLCGFIVEAGILGDNRDVVKGATAAGWILFLGLWGPILYAIYTLFDDVNKKYGDQVDPTTGKKVAIPGYVWTIVLSQLYFFAAFGFVQFGQVKNYLKGGSQNFETYERKYIKLSFVAKLALASGLGYGLILRTAKC